MAFFYCATEKNTVLGLPFVALPHRVVCFSLDARNLSFPLPHTVFLSRLPPPPPPRPVGPSQVLRRRPPEKEANSTSSRPPLDPGTLPPSLPFPHSLPLLCAPTPFSSQSGSVEAAGGEDGHGGIRQIDPPSCLMPASSPCCDHRLRRPVMLMLLRQRRDLVGARASGRRGAAKMWDTSQTGRVCGVRDGRQHGSCSNRNRPSLPPWAQGRCPRSPPPSMACFASHRPIESPSAGGINLFFLPPAFIVPVEMLNPVDNFLPSFDFHATHVLIEPEPMTYPQRPGETVCDVSIWNMKSVSKNNQNVDSNQRLLATMCDHFGTVNCVRWTKNGCYLASGSDDQGIIIHEWKAGSGTSEFGSGETADIGHWKVVMILRGHTANVVIIFQSFSMAVFLSKFWRHDQDLNSYLQSLAAEDGGEDVVICRCHACGPAHKRIQCSACALFFVYNLGDINS